MGKTWVCSQIIQALTFQSVSCLPIKPIHSGWGENELWGEDLACHSKWIESFQPQDLCAYRLKAPLSPQAAAKLEGVEIEINVLNHFWQKLNDLPREVLLIEGIGGVCCPLAPKTTYLDFLKIHRDACILISKIGLGSLNHAIMSAKLIEDSGLELLALVLNPEREFETDDAVYKEAKWQLESQLNCPILGPLARSSKPSVSLELAPLISEIVKRQCERT